MNIQCKALNRFVSTAFHHSQLQCNAFILTDSAFLKYVYCLRPHIVDGNCAQIGAKHPFVGNWWNEEKTGETKNLYTKSMCSKFNSSEWIWFQLFLNQIIEWIAWTWLKILFKETCALVTHKLWVILKCIFCIDERQKSRDPAQKRTHVQNRLVLGWSFCCARQMILIWNCHRNMMN